MGKEKKRKLNGLDKYVIFSFTVLILFYIAEFVTSTITGIEKTSLITAVTSVWGGEVLSCCLIKIFKLREEPKTNDNEFPEKDGAVG